MKWLVTATIIGIVAVSAFFIINTQDTDQPQPPASTSPTPTAQPQIEEDFTASFEIETLGTKRTFTDPRYHNIDPNIYLEAQDPSIINVKSSGLTWTDFFATLPMQISQECLTTGTRQLFCTNNTATLQFFINDIESTNALSQTISPNDHLQIIYKNN